MTTLRSVTASAIAAAVLATSVTPAMAQGYRGDGYRNPGQQWGGYRRDRNRGPNAGQVVGAIALVGIIAAIASASKNNRNHGGIGGEDAAANACAARVEQRFGGNGRASVEDVVRTRDGYEVRGTIDSRGYGRDYSNGQSFACSVRYGQVDDLRFDDGRGYQGY